MSDAAPPSPPLPPTAASKASPPKRHLQKYIFVFLGICLFITAVAFERCPWFQLSFALHEQTSAVRQSDARIAALEDKLRTIESESHATATPDAIETTSTAALLDNVKQMQAQIDKLQKENLDEKQKAQNSIVVAFAYWNLCTAAAEGHPYGPQLALLHKAIDDSPLHANVPAIQALDILFMHESSVPTLDALREELMTNEPEIIEADAPNTPVWQIHMHAWLHSLISIRPLHNPVFDPIEQSLSKEDLPDAEIAFSQLSEDTRAKLSPWHDQLKARGDIDAALRSLAEQIGVPTTEDGASMRAIP